MFHARYIPSMEQTQPPRLSPESKRATATAFAQWLRGRLADLGYNLTARGGGQRQLAAETGISAANISRLLSGDVLNPTPDMLRLLAPRVHASFPELLVRAGVVTAEELGAAQSAAGRPPETLEEIAAANGITDPTKVAVLAATIRALQERPGERAD